jgi:hypothetical protein
VSQTSRSNPIASENRPFSSLIVFGGNTARVAGPSDGIDRAQVIVGRHSRRPTGPYRRHSGYRASMQRERPPARMLPRSSRAAPVAAGPFARLPVGNPEKRCIKSRSVANRTCRKRIEHPGSALLGCKRACLDPRSDSTEVTKSRPGSAACQKVSSAPPGHRNEKPITATPGTSL